MMAYAQPARAFANAARPVMQTYGQPTTTVATAPRAVMQAQPVMTYAQPVAKEIDIVQANGTVLREFVQPAITQTQEIDIVQSDGTVLREFVQNTTQEIDVVQPNGTVLREFIQQPTTVTEVVQAPVARTRVMTREEMVRTGRLQVVGGITVDKFVPSGPIVPGPVNVVREIDIVQANGTVLREFVQPAITQTQEIDIVQSDGTVLREFVQNTTQEVDVVQPDGTVLREFVQSQPIVSFAR